MQPILIDDFNYMLPDERIARYPVSPRDSSKLLVYDGGRIVDDVFCHVGRYLPADSLLVYNNTRVIQARLVFRKPTGARIEVFCLEPVAPADYQLSLSATGGCEWKCMVGNLKKWKEGGLSRTVSLKDGRECVLQARRVAGLGSAHRVAFSWNLADVSFAELLDGVGELPIPPYLNRPTEESDKQTYQTVYSRIKGSVAAPTAGLHFTDSVLDGLRAQGIRMAELTLHVGAGTFQPVKTADANQHEMHSEFIEVSRGTIEQLLSYGGRVVAVGTTSVRTLESLYHLGVMLMRQPDMSELSVPQFAPYEEGRQWPETAEALRALLARLDRTGQPALHASTRIMIKPGYVYRVVSRIITNFHQPRSTLLLLVSAFIGDDWKHVYDHALGSGYRFLSYGDSSLLMPR